MNVTVEVARNQNESNTSVIRRFTKRVQDAGVLKRARSLRYSKRKPSPYAKKKGALIKLDKRKEFERLKRLGKVEEGFHKNPRKK